MPSRTLDLQNAINWNHPDAQGLQMLFLTLPETVQGNQRWLDLCGRTHGTLTGMVWPPTLTSGPGFGTSAPGGDGELRCDGSNDYVDLGDSSLVDYGTGNFACSAWFMTRSTAAPQWIFGKDAAGGRQFLFGINVNFPGDLQIAYFASATFLSLTTLNNLFVANTWHHALGQRIGSTFELYLDGALRATSGGATGTMDATATALYLGGRAYAANLNPFNGALNDLRTYARAFSPSGVFDLCQESAAGLPTLLNWDTEEEEDDWWPSPPAATRPQAGDMRGGFGRYGMAGGFLN